MHTDRILHPCVSDQDPEGGKSSADNRQPSGGEMEAFANLVPAKKHNSDKSSFHKEGENSLDSQRCPEDIPDKPTIVRPVGSELELEDQSRSDTDSEIDTE